MVSVVVEGDTDLPVVRKLVKDAKLDIALEIDAGGKGQIDQHFPGYNRSAKGAPWLVVRDLNSDAICAAKFLKGKPSPSKWMCFRIAVRELESWLLADRDGFADFFDVPIALLPEEPDKETDPTQTLVNVARRSRSGSIRKRMIPKSGMQTSVGPLYEATIIEFAEQRWSLVRAARRSDSLRRARRALKALGAAWGAYIAGVHG